MIPTDLGKRSESIYNALVSMTPDDFLKHSEWQQLGRRCDLETARRKLLREDGRALEVSRGEGYRMVKAGEHDRIAQQHGTKARRQVRRGRKTLSAALKHHAEELTTEEFTRFQGIEERMKQQENAIRTMHLRQERHEQAVNTLQTQKADRVELADFARRLAALEEKKAA